MRKEFKQAGWRALVKMSDKVFWLGLALLNGFAAQSGNTTASVIIIFASAVVLLVVFFVVESGKAYTAARPGTNYAIAKLSEIREIGKGFLATWGEWDKWDGMPPSHLPANVVPGIANLACPGKTKSREWANSVRGVLGSVGMRDLADRFMEDDPEMIRFFSDDPSGKKEKREYVRFMRHRLFRLEEIICKLSGIEFEAGISKPALP